MRFVHTITLSAFADTPEEAAAIEARLAALVPIDAAKEHEPQKKEKLAIAREACKGFNDRTIIVVRMVLSKQSQTNVFLKGLKESLGADQCKTLCAQENRLDEELDFFLRLKKAPFLDGVTALTDAGDCVHIRMSIAAFPRKKEAALAVVKSIFS